MDTVPGGHPTWAELLTLVGAVRQLAFDSTLPAVEAMAGSGTIHTITTSREHPDERQAGLHRC